MYKFDKRDLIVFLVCDLFKTNEKLAHCMENCQRLNTYKNHRTYQKTHRSYQKTHT